MRHFWIWASVNFAAHVQSVFGINTSNDAAAHIHTGAIKQVLGKSFAVHSSLLSVPSLLSALGGETACCN